MSATAAITIRTTEEDKKAIAAFAHSVGMSTSTFANVVLRQAVRCQRVVLEPVLEPTPHLEKILREVEADIKAGGRNISKGYTDVDEFFADLEAEAAELKEKERQNGGNKTKQNVR